MCLDSVPHRTLTMPVRRAVDTRHIRYHIARSQPPTPRCTAYVGRSPEPRQKRGSFVPANERGNACPLIAPNMATYIGLRT